MRRGVEWSTDEALWRLRALESAVWVGCLLSSQRNAHSHTYAHTLTKLGEVEEAAAAAARFAFAGCPLISGEVGRLKRSV